MAKKDPVPVIDLFAGPGGLGEGFSSVADDDGNRRFALRVSIEKDPVAYQTLSLRALFRAFPARKVPDCYYDYLRGNISRDELFSHPAVPQEARLAAAEAKQAELGKYPPEEIDKWISEALRGVEDWVLIGGPPCQAYSIAGRSRRRSVDPKGFEEDEKHLLYREYLRIIRRHSPSVFIMENVKGMLTSTHGGSRIFERILMDLSAPGGDFVYSVRSLVVPGEGADLRPEDFVIEAENFGLPQNRHRVILFGIRSDLMRRARDLDVDLDQLVLRRLPGNVTVKEALSGLPSLRSRLSRESDSHDSWLLALKAAVTGLKQWHSPARIYFESAMRDAWIKARDHTSHGRGFVPWDVTIDTTMSRALRGWLHDDRLGGVVQHETRAHMRSDLHRYLFASCFAALHGTSPKLAQFPPKLLPAHGNVNAQNIPFDDRFRVQVANLPSTTVVAHIAKDGHYYIHHDPSQCRSLTVREAARLQTFPDNYFFEGSRTDQYTQVGNAVPPWLARQIAELVLTFLERARDRESRQLVLCP